MPSRFSNAAAVALRRHFPEARGAQRLAEALDKVVASRIVSVAPLLHAAGVEEDCFTLEVLTDCALAGLDPGKLETDVLDDRQTLLLLRAMVHRLEAAIVELETFRKIKGIRA